MRAYSQEKHFTAGPHTVITTDSHQLGRAAAAATIAVVAALPMLMPQLSTACVATLDRQRLYLAGPLATHAAPGEGAHNYR